MAIASGMEATDPRTTLSTLVTERGASLAGLSRLIGRNDAYLQQYVTRGSPRALSEEDRRVLAAFLGTSEQALGGPAREPAMVRVARLDQGASAGPGNPVDDDRVAGGEAIDPAVLRQLGLRADDLSIVVARGDSMFPTIADGDAMLIDRNDRRVDTRGGIFVARIDGAVVVKRLARRGGALTVSSDNPDYPPLRPDDVEIIGRVCRLTRTLR